MKELTSRQRKTLYKSLADYLLAHPDPNTPVYELFNRWCDLHHQHVEDDAWAAHIRSWLSFARKMDPSVLASLRDAAVRSV